MKLTHQLLVGLILAGIASVDATARATDVKSYMPFACRLHSGSGTYWGVGHFSAGASGATLQCPIVRESMVESIEYVDVLVRDNDVGEDFDCHLVRRSTSGGSLSSPPWETEGTTGANAFEHIRMFLDSASGDDSFNPTDDASVMLVCIVPPSSSLYSYYVEENE